MTDHSQLAAGGPEEKCRDYGLLSRAVMNVCLGSSYSGYILGYFNTLNFDDTVRIFSIEADRALMQGSLSFCVAIGAAFGGYYARLLIDRFSRRDCFLVISAVGMVATLLLQTKAVPLMFLCRLVQGATVGTNTVLRSTYIKEFSPLELAGRFGTLNQVFFAVGLITAFLLVFLLSFFLEAESYWRFIYIFPLFFLALQCYNFLYVFPFETPKYLLEKGRREEARGLITKLYKPHYVDQRLQELEKHINISAVKQDQELTTLPLLDPPAGQKEVKLTSNKIAVRIACWTAALQQLSGIQVIILYAGEIMLSIEPRLQKVIPLIVQIEGFAASMYTMRLVETHGRKELIQWGLTRIGLIHLVVSFCFLLESGNGEEQATASLVENVVIVAGLLSCRWIFSMTIGPIVWLYIPEIVEPEVNGVATMLNWLAAASVSFAYPVLVELTGSPSLIFLIFAVFVFAGVAVNARWMVETKNKPEWQVRREYDAMLQA